MRNRTTPELCKERHAFAEESLARKSRPTTAMPLGYEIGKTLLEGRAERDRTAVIEGVREVGDKKQRGYLGFRRNCKRRVGGKANTRSSRGEDVESMYVVEVQN